MLSKLADGILVLLDLDIFLLDGIKVDLDLIFYFANRSIGLFQMKAIFLLVLLKHELISSNFFAKLVGLKLVVLLSVLQHLPAYL
jgi:hypothetical protein